MPVGKERQQQAEPSLRARLGRWLLWAVGAWLLFVALPSVPAVRAFLAAPLIVEDTGATGDAAYVLAAGYALQERLRTSADLYHMGRVPRLLLLRDNSRAGHNFVAGASWRASEMTVDYLRWLGVPGDAITLLNQSEHGFFGTLTEARMVARQRPDELQRLLLVTSAPHTRRSLLAFRRTLPADVEVVVVPATSFVNSAERTEPLWLEYCKLLVYFVVA